MLISPLLPLSSPNLFPFLLPTSSYTLWYTLSCPQPSQPNLQNLPLSCVPSSLTLLTVVPETQLSYVFASSNYTSHPLPYTSYQFQVRAANSAGYVTSDLSSINTTLTSGGC